jgi:chitin disaccharide deacetylase
MASVDGRRLIVNADDFGRSDSINQAVIRAHKEGILTTASLMVNGAAFEEAVALAKAHPALGVGLHLTLVCGRSTLPQADIPLLVNPQSEFTNNPVEGGMQYFFQTAARYHLEKEITAQFEKFEKTGLILDHVNGHLHFHLHPTVLKIFCSLVSRFKVRAVRLTSEPAGINLLQERGRWLYRLSHAAVFHALSRRARLPLENHNLRFTRQVFGLLQDGHVDEDYILRLLPQLPAGDSELYSHPSLDKFKHEFDALISPRVRELIRREHIQLIRYREL